MFLNRIYSSTMPIYFLCDFMKLIFDCYYCAGERCGPRVWLILISYTVYFKTDESIKARFHYL